MRPGRLVAFQERLGAIPEHLVAVAIPERLGANDGAVDHHLVAETATTETEIAAAAPDTGIKILLRLR